MQHAIYSRSPCRPFAASVILINVNYRQFFLQTAINIGLVVLGALLFALGFPNFIADWGWAPLAWISLVPVVLLVRRINWYFSPLWGAVYGYGTYALFNFWLATFNPVSFVLVPAIYAGYFFMLFPLLSLADKSFKRWGWLAQWLLWALFEVLRTKGFLAYSYGVIGYSQYGWRSLIAIADVFGIMGVSMIVSFPSFLLGGYLLQAGFLKRSTVPSGIESESLNSRTVKALRWRIPALTFLGVLLTVNIYGIATRVDYSDSPRWRPALIQHNMNTWLEGIEVWRRALGLLIDESKAALQSNPDAIIWSETAFVPSIAWHSKYRQERQKVELINRLESFLSNVDIPLLTGNNDGVMRIGQRKDYNAVLLMDKGSIVERYRKIHLVPFSEHFPYAEIFPRLMEYIQSQGTPLYLSGSEYTVFDLGKWNGPKLSPLICFEDTFGYLSRGFVREGAEVLVNVTNDSWSPEPACAIQHATMAIFRAVENRRSMVRATNSGLSSVIDPNGKIIQKLDNNIQGHLIAEVPVYTERNTLYTRYGDWFEKLIIALGIAVLGIGILKLFRKKLQIRS